MSASSRSTQNEDRTRPSPTQAPRVSDPSPLPHQDKATAPKAQWHLSPYKYLHRRHCPCISVEPDILTAHAQMTAQLHRLEKVWRRLTSSRMPPELKDTGTRLLLSLRASGWEQFHFLAHQILPQRGKREEHSILLLIPSHEAASGHRWVAEILVHRYAHGSRKGKIENIASRLAEDWEDWSLIHDHQYFEIEGDRPLEIVIPDEGNAKAVDLIEELWGQVAEMLGGDDASSKKEFLRMISRVTAEITSGGGRLVHSFEIALRFRNSSMGKAMVPCVMVSLFATPAEGEKDRPDQRDESNPEGVILIDTNGTQGQTKPMMVMYHAGSPIAHSYRKTIPPPKPEDWTGLLKRNPSPRVFESERRWK